MPLREGIHVVDPRMITALSDADACMVAAYVHGEMAEQERLAFEVRLVEEPTLAACVRACFDTDELLWRSSDVLGARQRSFFRRLRRPTLFTAVAASLLLAGIL